MAEKQLFVLSDTGPLVSAFQSDSFDLLNALVGTIHTTSTCLAELIEADWREQVQAAGARLVQIGLTESETARARQFAEQIAQHPATKMRDPAHHLGEAEIIALAQRAEMRDAIIWLDEHAAREVAADAGLTVSGFAGALLVAVEAGLVNSAQVKNRLERCRQLGTHYSHELIERVYRAAKEIEG